MNKKIILLFITCFLILNIFYIKSFYFNVYWNLFFGEKSYDKAINNFIKSNNIYWVYNEANSIYKKWDFKEAIRKYLSIYWNDKSLLNFALNHNIWNSYYKLSEKVSEKEIQIKYLEQSVNYYSKALDIKYDEETKKNLEFILNKINENKKSESKKNESEKSKDNTSSWVVDDSRKIDKSNEQNVKEQNVKEQNVKSVEFWINTKENELTEKQKESIKKYTETLKQDQIENNEYFNKVYEDNNNTFDDLFEDSFINNILNRVFNNDLLNWWNNKKDW